MDQNLKDLVTSLGDKVAKHMDELKVADAIDDVFEVLRASNKYIDETTPWILAKDETKQDRLKEVLYNLIESIRVCAVYLQAFLPDTAEKIFNQINTDLKSYDSTKTFGGYVSGTKVNTPEILFARIDTTKDNN
jgi:methionyl-tRNA synthetase